MGESLESESLARQRIEAFAERVRTIRASLHEVLVGQDATIDQLLICALTGSHALLVGVPGLAKTLMVKALAAAFEWKYARIQFTPDLMPSDITGYELLGRDDAGAPHDGLSAGTRVRQPGVGRRNQSGRAEDAIGVARSDGRASRDSRRQDVSPGRAVPRRGDAESDRAGGHVSVA